MLSVADLVETRLKNGELEEEAEKRIHGELEKLKEVTKSVLQQKNIGKEVLKATRRPPMSYRAEA